VEIKCQLDATEVLIADLIACSTCFGHHYTHHQELKSIIQWLLPVVFRAVVCYGVEGYVSGLQDAAFKHHPTYRVSQEECEILRESVPYVKLYRYDPKHLYPKLNGYGDNGQRKVWTSCISVYCTSTAVSH